MSYIDTLINRAQTKKSTKEPTLEERLFLDRMTNADAALWTDYQRKYGTANKALTFFGGIFAGAALMSGFFGKWIIGGGFLLGYLGIENILRKNLNTRAEREYFPTGRAPTKPTNAKDSP